MFPTVEEDLEDACGKITKTIDYFRDFAGPSLVIYLNIDGYVIDPSC